MITQERSIEIRILAKQRKKIREIARTMGISKNTARRYLRSKTWQRYKKRLKRPWSEAADYRRDRLVKRHRKMTHHRRPILPPSGRVCKHPARGLCDDRIRVP